MSDPPLNEEALGAWLQANLPGFELPFRLTKFPSGQSNPTYKISSASGDYVLRRKPFGPLLPSAHAVDREYRLLSALHPLGFPVPTIKISSNTAIAEKKPHWIDFNAGAVLDGTASEDELTDNLFNLVLDVASGRKQAKNEENGYREIAIWKEGVTL